MDPMKLSIALALGLVGASCASAPQNVVYPTANVDPFKALSNIKTGREVTLSGYLFDGLETSGLYKLPDPHASGDQCVRMDRAKVRGFKVGEEKVVVKGTVRRSDANEIIFHACQTHYFEDFVILER